MSGTHGFVLASLTSQITSWIGHHGAYAVFAIMALDALLPVGGELTMLFAGALAEWEYLDEVVVEIYASRHRSPERPVR